MKNGLPYDAETQLWLRAAARGAAWFAGQRGQDGRLPAGLHDLGSYYKWPLALISLGRTDEAADVLRIVLHDFATADGDLRSTDEKSADAIYGRIADSYTNTWPIAAARILGQEEEGLRGLDCLRRRHVATTGGYLTGLPGQYEDARQDIVTIAGCGNALLAWGFIEEAAGAGECLLRILASQPEQDAPFDLYIDGDGQLLSGDLGIEERLSRIDPGQAGQAYVYWGMASVFLARLTAVSGDERFLQGARGYFARHDACDEAHVLDGIGCCKTGWAASVLYRLTGERVYRDWVHAVAGQLVSAQFADGTWHLPVSPILDCDCTGELVYHLTQYCLELSGR